MTQLERVKKWLPNWQQSIYSLNTEGDRYYGYTFYSQVAWDGMFMDNVEFLRKEFRHVMDLTTGELV